MGLEKLLKYLAQLAGASVIAQIISFSIMPIITRLHTPTSLGEYQLFTTIALVLGPFTTGSIHLAIQSSNSKYSALITLKLGVQYSLLIFILLLALLPLEILILQIVNLSWFAYYLPLLLIYLLLAANFQFAMAYLTNSRDYAKQSTYSITRSGISNFLKLVLSRYFSATSFSLILPLILTEIMQLVRVVGRDYKKLFKFVFNFSLFNFKRKLNERKAYPTYVSLTSSISIVRNWFPILVTSSLYSPKYTGLLGLTFMVINTPVYPFISALQTVCFGELAQDNSLKKMLSVYKKSFLLAIIPAISGLVTLSLFGEKLFSIIFGKEWITSGSYAAICFFPIALSILLSPIYTTMNHFFSFQKLFFWINLLFLAIGLTVTTFIGLNNLPFTYFLIAFSITMSINHLALFAISILLSCKRVKLLAQ